MGRNSPVFLPVIFLVAWFCGAARAGADPIRVRSGFVEAAFNLRSGTRLNIADVQILGTGFTIESIVDEDEAFVQLDRIPTLADGAFVDLSATLFGVDVIGASLDGVFAFVAAPFTMSFVASPTRLACQGDSSLLQCNGVAPFTFEAQLTLTPLRDGSPVTQLFIGNGTVEARLFRGAFGEDGGVRYTFSQTSATPEPAALSLFSIGVFMTGAGMSRRRRAGGAHRDRRGHARCSAPAAPGLGKMVKNMEFGVVRSMAYTAAPCSEGEAFLPG